MSISISERVKRLRFRLGFTQAVMAKAIGLKRAGTVSQWEHGKPIADKNLRLMAYLTDDPEATYGWLRDGGDEPPVRPLAAPRRHDLGPTKGEVAPHMPPSARAIQARLLKRLSSLVDQQVGMDPLEVQSWVAELTQAFTGSTTEP